jgi:hypothetical protein
MVVASCGSPAQKEADIATAVALTVQAQNSLTQVASLPTLTPASLIEDATSTPENIPTETPSAATNPGCDPAASLIGEYPPDKAVIKPGKDFLKTWTFLNTGTCTWDNTYKLVFWGGDTIGASPSYNFSDFVLPGETMEISIFLKAPEAEGTLTGFWRMQTPWGENFGVGQYDQNFYVEIKVSSERDFGITDITMTSGRDPLTGCPVNVRWQAFATISVDGRFAFDYYWQQSDGERGPTERMIFTETGSKTVKWEWMLHKGATQNPRWIQLIVTTDDRTIKSDKVTFTNNCP